MLQGRVLGDLMIQDGGENIAILNRQDSYGTGLAAEVKKSVETGGGTIAGEVAYDPAAPDFSADVAKIKEANPDSIALISFDETKKLIPELEKQGLGPDKVKIYFVDGNLADYSADFPEGLLEGVKGTLPGAASEGKFKENLLKTNPDLRDFSYAPGVLRRHRPDRPGRRGGQGRLGHRHLEEPGRGQQGRHEVHRLQGLPRPAEGRH